VSVLQDGARVVVQPPPVQTVLVISDLEIPGIGNVDVPDVGRGSFWDSDSERLRRCGPGSRSIVARPAATRKAAMPRCTDSGHRGVARTWDEGVTSQTPNWPSRGCRRTRPGVDLNAHEGQRATDARAEAGAPPGVSRRAGTDARQRISSVAPPSVTSDAGPAPIPSVRWADVARAGPGQHAAMGSGVTPAPAGEAHRCARLGSGTAQRGPAVDRSPAPLCTFPARASGTAPLP
jgi:hypothetical protein